MAYVVATTTAGSCYACPPPEEEPPFVAAIHILPPEVWAAPGTSFSVRARLLDEWGNAFPDDRAAGLLWETGSHPAPNLTVQPPAKGSSVTVTVPGGGPHAPFVLIAKLDGYAPRTISVKTMSTGFSGSELDIIRAKHSNGDPPSIALVDGKTSITLTDSLFAFTGQGPLDVLDCGVEPKCGEVTLFSRTQGLAHQTQVTWTSRCDDVDLTNGPTTPACVNANPVTISAPALRVVPVHYVILTEGGAVPDASTSSTSAIGPPTLNVAGTIEADVEFGRKVLADSWTGLDLPRPTPGSIHTPSVATSVTVASESADGCMDQEIPVGTQLNEAGANIDPKRITVAYVDQLLDVNGDEITWARGFACPWTDAYGSIILVSWSLWSPTVLAHELAHALGPWQTYPWGHTEDIPGFNESNLLWNYEVDTKPAPRSIISLGQAFRLSLDLHAFFQRGGPPSSLPSCQFFVTPDSPDTPCPRLSRDIVRP